MNKKSWLDMLFYKIGKQNCDFRMNYIEKKEDDSVFATKYKTYSQICFPLNSWESWKIKENNREILPNEVVIDLEKKEKIGWVINKLKNDCLTFYVFDTGSRGYHIHIFFQVNLNSENKKKIIQRYGGDEQKAGNRTTIAMEYANHWKTGKIKELIENGS